MRPAGEPDADCHTDDDCGEGGTVPLGPLTSEWWRGQPRTGSEFTVAADGVRIDKTFTEPTPDGQTTETWEYHFTAQSE